MLLYHCEKRRRGKNSFTIIATVSKICIDKLIFPSLIMVTVRYFLRNQPFLLELREYLIIEETNRLAIRFAGNYTLRGSRV